MHGKALMAVLAQRPVTTDYQVMMGGVTMMTTMGRNPFPERNPILDPNLFGPCLYLPTHLRYPAIISLIRSSSGQPSLHYFFFGKLGRVVV